MSPPTGGRSTERPDMPASDHAKPDSAPAVPPRVAVIGGGPAGLMAAEIVAGSGRAAVTVFDRMPTFGRKFLMAGRGGLNLTHGEERARFIARYGEAETALAPAIEAFPPEALREWAAGLGEETFVGTSGRVFPKSLKASPLLRSWLRRLAGQGVAFAPRHRWSGFDEEGALVFETPRGTVLERADAVILALGGASWPRLGSDGSWVPALAALGAAVRPLEPANCGFGVAWSEGFRVRFAGEPLKRIALTHGDVRVRGEAVVTAAGIEGGAVYALSRPLREAIRREGGAQLGLDLRPDLDADALAGRLRRAGPGQSLSNRLRKAGLAPVAAGLLREAAPGGPPADPDLLARLVKNLRLDLVAPFPIDRAISSAGGLRLGELDGTFMVKARPGLFVAGEMLDWEAPTGGYLLQACFATGAAAGRGALRWLTAGT